MAQYVYLVAFELVDRAEQDGHCKTGRDCQVYVIRRVLQVCEWGLYTSNSLVEGGFAAVFRRPCL